MIDGVDDTRGSVVAGGRGYYLKVCINPGVWDDDSGIFFCVPAIFNGGTYSITTVCTYVHPVHTYARYIRRLPFVLVSGLFCHCGVKNCVVGLTNR